MRDIGNPSAAARVAAALKLSGPTSLFLHESLQPVVIMEDLRDPDLLAAGRAHRAVGFVNCALGAGSSNGRVQNPVGSFVTLNLLRLTIAPLAALGGRFAWGVGDNTNYGADVVPGSGLFVNLRDPANAAGVLHQDTVTGGLQVPTPHGFVSVPAAGNVVVDLTGLVLVPGFSFRVGSLAPVAVDYDWVWDEVPFN